MKMKQKLYWSLIEFQSSARSNRQFGKFGYDNPESKTPNIHGYDEA